MPMRADAWWRTCGHASAPWTRLVARSCPARGTPTQESPAVNRCALFEAHAISCRARIEVRTDNLCGELRIRDCHGGWSTVCSFGTGSALAPRRIGNDAVVRKTGGASMRTERVIASIAAVWLASTSLACAQQYPNRPIRLVVGFSPGGNADVSARLVAARMSEALGASMVVDNRAGAAGVVAAQIVARAPADGHTLAWSSQGALTISQITDKNPPYNSLTAFAPIGRTYAFANALLVRPDFPAKSAADIVTMAKQKPGDINFATQGVGSAGHLSAQMLQKVAGIRMAHVPYKGGSDVIVALLGGDVRVGFVATTTAANVRGKLRVLAVTGRDRDPSLPDVPSMREAGLEGYDATFWFGMLAPAGTPQPIIKRLNGVLQEILKDPALAKITIRQGLNPVPSSPEELATLIRTEMDRWRDVVTVD
jgi:tripartite-type tricarboxylate transporter receptor subunit TctC